MKKELLWYPYSRRKGSFVENMVRMSRRKTGGAGSAADDLVAYVPRMALSRMGASSARHITKSGRYGSSWL